MDTVDGGSRGRRSKCPKEAVEFVTDLAKARADKTLSDVTILCSGGEHRVHKLILCSRSDVFAAMLSSSMSEAECGRIEIKDVDTQVMHLFIRFV